MTRRTRTIHLSFFAGVVGVFVVIISARLLLVAGIPRSATADPETKPATNAKPRPAPGDKAPEAATLKNTSQNEQSGATGISPVP